MKKLLLSLITLATASVAMAQAIDDVQHVRPFHKSPVYSESIKMCEDRQISRSDVGVVDDLILAPEGTIEMYSMRGIGIQSIYGGLQEALMQGATDIVWGEDGKVYIHNPLGAFAYGYVEGTLNEDGTEIKVQLPQTVAAMNYYTQQGEMLQFPLKLSVMIKTTTAEEDAEDGPEYLPEQDPDKNVLIYSIDDKGYITQKSPYLANFEPDEVTYLKYPEEMLSCYLYAPNYVIYGGDLDFMIEYWYGYTNLNQIFAPLPDDLIVNEIPEDLEWNNNWAIKSTNAWNELVLGAISDGKIYLKDLSYLIPDAVVVGDIEGDKVIFKDKQYMGICERMNRYITFRGAYSYYDGVDEWTGEPRLLFALTNEDVVMDYDAETQTLSINDGTKGFLMNSLLMDDYVYYYCAFDSPNIHLQTLEDYAAAPLNPTIVAWNDYSEWYDHPYYGATFSFAQSNENGAIVNYDDIYYRVFFNDEIFTFSPDEGYGIEEEMEWLSTTFIDANWTIMGYGDMAMVYFYEEGISKIGLQSAYIAPDGTIYPSEIVSMTLTESIKDMTASELVKTEMYDIQGRKLIAPKAGTMVIEVSTYADGTTRVKKVIK